MLGGRGSRIQSSAKTLLVQGEIGLVDVVVCISRD